MSDRQQTSDEWTKMVNSPKPVLGIHEPREFNPTWLEGVPPQPSPSALTREQVLIRLVDKFLAWPLPDSVCSDLCATKQGYPHRSGTTLLAAHEAKQMFEHVLSELLDTFTEQRQAIARLKDRNSNLMDVLRAIAVMKTTEADRMQQWAKDGLSGFTEPIESTVLKLTNDLQAMTTARDEAVRKQLELQSRLHDLAQVALTTVRNVRKLTGGCSHG